MQVMITNTDLYQKTVNKFQENPKCVYLPCPNSKIEKHPLTVENPQFPRQAGWASIWDQACENPNPFLPSQREGRPLVVDPRKNNYE